MALSGAYSAQQQGQRWRQSAPCTSRAVRASGEENGSASIRSLLAAPEEQLHDESSIHADNPNQCIVFTMFAIEVRGEAARFDLGAGGREARQQPRDCGGVPVEVRKDGAQVLLLGTNDGDIDDGEENGEGES